MIRKLLIANRGEIACRVIKTARLLEIRTVVIYTAADAGGLPATLADEAVLIDDYLNGAAIVAAAQAHAADAVHPGCGFLSEQADFAAACRNAGLIFVGPSAAVMTQAADKAAARRLAQAAGVAVIPGFDDSAADDAALAAAAAQIGYPLLIKAAAGGGGRGIRIVTSEAAFAPSLAEARREAASGFGDSAVILEKYISPARHLEVQLLCDDNGGIAVLGERDCSLQRRHQKILEEAPAPDLPDEVRHRLHEAARTLASAFAYRNAGTVEFLLDAEKSFYFMEVNARLQVEHPVTEMIYGIDLVEWQLRLAAGEALPEFKRRQRCAIEARICAENPQNGFLPATGHLRRCNFPAATDDVRVDSGVAAGSYVGGDYDSMLAKIIAAGDTRAEALANLQQALSATHIAGIATNIAFLHELTGTAEVAAAAVKTNTLDERVSDWTALLTARYDRLAALAAAAGLFAPVAFPVPGFRLNALPESAAVMTAAGMRWTVQAQAAAADVCHVHYRRCNDDGDEVSGDAVLTAVRVTAGRIDALWDNRPVHAEFDGDRRHCFADGLAVEFSAPELAADAASGDGGNAAVAPMNAVVTALMVEAGAQVEKGETLLTLEAMKMEMPVVAAVTGVVTAVHCQVGEQVTQGAVLANISVNGIQ